MKILKVHEAFMKQIRKYFLRYSSFFFVMSAPIVSQPEPKVSQAELSTMELCDDSLSLLYNNVVSTYNLNQNGISEPLSQNFIRELMTNSHKIPLRDTNFNHFPENQANFWEIITNGIKITQDLQYAPTLNAEQKKRYKITAYKMLAQISCYKNSNNHVDLEAYNNLKTFLYFEKVIKYKDNYDEVLKEEIGFVDERTEAFGRNWQDLRNLQSKSLNNKGILTFARALYENDKRFILSYEDSIRANQISKIYLNKWLKQQNIQKQLWYNELARDAYYTNVSVCKAERGDKVDVSITVDPTGDLGCGAYSPVGNVIIHELQHLMQAKPASWETAEDNRLSDREMAKKVMLYDYDGIANVYIDELGPTLYSLALDDVIYKNIHKIHKDKELNYGKLKVGQKELEIGKVAVFFRKMIQKYPYRSVDKILLEKEVFNQLSEWGKTVQRTNDLYVVTSYER